MSTIIMDIAALWVIDTLLNQHKDSINKFYVSNSIPITKILLQAWPPTLHVYQTMINYRSIEEFIKSPILLPPQYAT